MSTDKPNVKDLFRYEIADGYETGGLLYFRFEDKEMVAIIRDRAEFDKHLQDGITLQDYADTAVSWEAYGAALVLEELIPKKPLPSREVPQSSRRDP